MVHIQIKMFCTWAHWKCWLLKFRWYRSITLFCSKFYVTSHFIHLTQYIDNTYSVKQMCTSVLLKLNIKLFFGIKQITQIIWHKEANECMQTHFFIFLFKILYDFNNSNVCVTFPDNFFSWSRKMHNYHRQNIKAKLIKQCLQMHILIMTINKLNNVHISVFCSNACLSLI